jgi:hypothetical protein
MRDPYGKAGATRAGPEPWRCDGDAVTQASAAAEQRRLLDSPGREAVERSRPAIRAAERGRLNTNRARPCRIASGPVRWMAATMRRSSARSAHRRLGKMTMTHGEFTREADRTRWRRRTGDAAALARASGRRYEPSGDPPRPRKQPDANSSSSRGSGARSPRPSKKPNRIEYGIPGIGRLAGPPERQSTTGWRCGRVMDPAYQRAGSGPEALSGSLSARK